MKVTNPIRVGIAFGLGFSVLAGAAAGSAGKGKKAKSDSPAATSAANPADCRVGGSALALSDLNEASGIAVSRRTPGILWSHVDATSAAPVLVAFDAHGSAKGKVRVEGVKVEDWEDVAAGSCGKGACLYIGDIGDNRSSRSSVTVYRVPEPLATDSKTEPAEAFHAKFPDGAHDAEALFVSAAGEIFVVTKGDAGPIAIYRFPTPLRAGATVTLEKVATLKGGTASKSQWVTGASASADGKWVALRTHQTIFFYDAARLAKGDVGHPLSFDVTKLAEPQGEGVALGPDGALFLASEGGRKGAPGKLSAAVCKLVAPAEAKGSQD